MKVQELKSLVKAIIREMIESTEPSIGGSYSDQQTNVDAHNVRLERDPLTDPLLTGKPFKKDI